MTYAELSNLPAEAYLNANKFRTVHDSFPEAGYADRRYREAHAMGVAGGVLHIGQNSVWAFEHKDGSNTWSSEGIGYHSCTYAVLQGFLDSGCKIKVHRRGSTSEIK